jgi:hypothetical protein
MGAGRRAAAAIAAAAVLLAPALAHACAVCGGGNPANRFTFFASTISLSLLPLGLFVAAFLWLRPRILRNAGDEFRERDADTPDATRPKRVR